jgi:hypothetical protein
MEPKGLSQKTTSARAGDGIADFAPGNHTQSALQTHGDTPVGDQTATRNTFSLSFDPQEVATLFNAAFPGQTQPFAH